MTEHAVSILVSILVAKCVCIMRKIIVNLRRFFAPQRFPKVPQSIDKQRKTSNLNGLLVFLIWSGIRESNPLKSTVKPLKTLRFLLLVSIFVSILREKSGHSDFRLDPVSVCDVRVNAYHRLIVCPSA